ncbi:hypothetical protein U9M48_011537 [Paspalum notatum var. saurae]|uniref:Uncharacterized protein n=1 Tax=Paspalum notatum var. saurae TaxID=547442 RepID=A0AAQ3WHH3_PASNO
MAEMLFSVVVQEAISKGVSFVLDKREEKKASSQGHLMERMEMAVGDLELALERSAKLPITEVSLLQRRKAIKFAYAEAMELLDKHKQGRPPVHGLEESETTQGLKRKRSWIIRAKSLFISSSAGFNLKMDDVRRFEWFADCAGRFVRDVESGCSLRHYTFCSPIASRHLLEGKTLKYESEQGNELRQFYIWPTCSKERGVEAVLQYLYKDSAAVEEKSFCLMLALRLSESTDIIQTLRAHMCPPWAGIQEWYMENGPLCRPDPACCRASRHGLCGSNGVSSESLSHMFPEQVHFFCFIRYVSALAQPAGTSSHSCCSSEETGCRSGGEVGRGDWMSPLAMAVAFVPHYNYAAVEKTGNANRRGDASIEQVGETLKSDAIKWFLRQPQLTEYKSDWHAKHGAAWFDVYKPRSQRTRWLQQDFQAATTMDLPAPST